jgi:hypothetical protein
MVRFAWQDAKRVHEGQEYGNGSGIDKMYHLADLALTHMEWGSDAITTTGGGILHEEKEDAGVTSEELGQNYPPSVVQIVDAMSYDPSAPENQLIISNALAITACIYQLIRRNKSLSNALPRPALGFAITKADTERRIKVEQTKGIPPAEISKLIDSLSNFYANFTMPIDNEKKDVRPVIYASSILDFAKVHPSPKAAEDYLTKNFPDDVGLSRLSDEERESLAKFFLEEKMVAQGGAILRKP